MKTLAQAIEDLLPQTQCTQCGFEDCRAYAQAIASNQANYNQCPPGGAEGIKRLADFLHQPPILLNPEHGQESPRTRAVINEDLCIGCTLCIQACPVDAIVGAAKKMHTVVEEMCTGCRLCIASCPVDCIQMEQVTITSGWEAWSDQQANAARFAHQNRRERLMREKAEREQQLQHKQAALHKSDSDEQKNALIEAALARVQSQKN